MIDTLKILGYYSLIITVLGTVGNFLIVFVSVKTKSNSMFILLRYLAFNDAISLYFWNLSHFIESSFLIDIQNYNIYLCKFGTWIQYSSLQSSVWVLVLMSVDRYLIFKIQKWKKVYFTKKIATITGLLLTIFIYLFNSNVLFTYGYAFESNGTIVTQCFATIPSTYWMDVWSEVHSYMYSFIPFVVLAIINILLIVDLRQKAQETSQATNSTLDSRTKRNINISVIAITILFIVFTCMSAIASQYYNVLVHSYNGYVLLYAADCVAFSFHALNIIILWVTNKQFVRKFKESFGIPDADA